MSGGWSHNGCVVCGKGHSNYYDFICPNGLVSVCLCDEHKNIKEHQVKNGYLLKRVRRK